MNKNYLVCGISAALALGSTILSAGPKPVAIEKELLGVRVLQNYRDVLVRYGAPTRVFRATETVNYTEATNLAGESTGGILGIAGSTSGGGGGAGGAGGPMMSGGQDNVGGRSMGGPPGGAPGMMMGGSSRRSGSQGMAGGPSMAGGPGAPGGGTGGGTGGGGGGGAQGDNPDASYSESGGYVWVYHYPGKELAYEFRFNKDGRVERIAEMGRGWGQHTSRGIGLGDTLDRIYSVYGWTDSIKEEETGKFSLLYNDKYHAQFLVLKGKVIGISVFLKENQFTNYGGTAAAGGGGGGAAGGPMGGSGGSSMSPGRGGSGGQFTPQNKPQIGPRAGG